MQESSNQNTKKCIKCKESFIYMPDEIKWVEFGTYSAKITTCPYCGATNVIKYIDAPGLYTDRDKRYYYK